MNDQSTKECPGTKDCTTECAKDGTSHVPYSPIYLKNAALRYAALAGDTGFVRSIDLDVLINQSMLDADALSPFTAVSLGEGQTLNSIAEKTGEEFLALDELNRFLEYHLQRPGTEEKQKQVIKLLDTDIMREGLLEKLPGLLNEPLRTKVEHTNHPYTVPILFLP